MDYKHLLLEKIENKSAVIAVIGLGYVGLPLAVEFGKQFTVVGFDVKEERIKELQTGIDRTLEVSKEELTEAKGLTFTYELDKIKNLDFYIVTVPTPIDDFKRPDLTPLIKASETLGKVIGNGSIVIYESTVYPGCTEEDCVPMIEKVSGKIFNSGFFCGYSPERINPGDKEHRVSTIKKVTSGSTPVIGIVVNELYKTIHFPVSFFVIPECFYRESTLFLSLFTILPSSCFKSIDTIYYFDTSQLFYIFTIEDLTNY